MVQFLYILAALGAVIGAFVGFTYIGAANGAPQQAAGAAMALAWAIIPYCLARAAHEYRRADAEAKAAAPAKADLPVMKVTPAAADTGF